MLSDIYQSYCRFMAHYYPETAISQQFGDTGEYLVKDARGLYLLDGDCTSLHDLKRDIEGLTVAFGWMLDRLPKGHDNYAAFLSLQGVYR